MVPGDAESQKLPCDFPHHVRNIASTIGSMINMPCVRIVALRARIDRYCSVAMKVILKVVREFA
jgi:hypothetical protein